MENKKMKYISIFVTVPNVNVANKITEFLVEKKLVACVNIIPKIKSVYWWENKVCKSNEHLLVAKTIKSNFNKIVKEVKKIHPYEVPEIVCVDIKANKDYLMWIKEYAK
ncbi:divalent-cation tolerance protein CutA [Candidatus Ruminimicrobiellum ovillum]|uniref:divalent-cation tolerance protein CutA n=1 Tax=Candidatus Ruminimicrobiellum ovillum TaxID=1947927 RepID=UPI0035597608